MLKKIIITGGCGFIGSEIIRKLLRERDYFIFNIDKKNIKGNHENIERLFDENISYKNRYKLYNCDICEFELLNQIIIDIKPDMIINLAAETHVDKSIDNPKLFLDSNVIGTFNLIEIIRDYLKFNARKNFKLIHISTDEVFGSLSEGGKFNENSRYQPNSPYSASKACSDHLIRAWMKTYNMPFIITNCSNNYGPWQFPEKLIPLAITKAIRKEKIPIYGNGQQIRDWLHVSDHADAIIKIAEKGLIGRSYCIGGDSEKSNLETIHLICDYLDEINPENYPHKNLITFVEDRPGHDKRYAIDSSLIKEELNWFPKKETRDIVEDLILNEFE